MAAKYEVRKATDGQFYWVLVAANGEVVATSELYTTEGHAIDGITAAITASAEASGAEDIGVAGTDIQR